MTNKLVTLHNVSYQIENKKILNQINFEINASEFVILLGANGVGKSTLLKIISGALRSTLGEVKKTNELTISYLGHRSQLYLDLTVVQNVEFFTKFFSLQVTTEELLLKWNLVNEGDLLVRQLSQGQLKRLSLGVFLTMKASLYLLDEPNSNLDQLGKELLLQELIALKEKGWESFLLITHEIGDYFSLADRILYLGSKGIEEIYSREETTLSIDTVSQIYIERLRR